MPKGWNRLDTVDTEEGTLELYRRGAGDSLISDFLITVGGRVLMNGDAHLSEVLLGELAARSVAGQSRPAVLIGGLGLGYTLRAALDGLGGQARVLVAELNPEVVRWCRGPLREIVGDALDDPRTSIHTEDVAEIIDRAGSGDRFDVIALDLYEGPHAGSQGREDPFYGPKALRRTRKALKPGGTFAIWSEKRDAAFEKRVPEAGFRLEYHLPERGPRHVVYLART